MLTRLKDFVAFILVCVLGLDLCYGRWDNSLHRLTDFGSAIRPLAINKTVTLIQSFHYLRRKGGLCATTLLCREVQWRSG